MYCGMSPIFCSLEAWGRKGQERCQEEREGRYQGAVICVRCCFRGVQKNAGLIRVLVGVGCTRTVALACLTPPLTLPHCPTAGVGGQLVGCVGGGALLCTHLGLQPAVPGVSTPPDAGGAAKPSACILKHREHQKRKKEVIRTRLRA